MTVRAPIRAPVADAHERGDRRGRIDRRRPRATSASRCTPAGSASRGAKSSIARAKAKYGFAARSIAHGAASARSPRITADARVAAQRGRVLRVGEERQVAGAARPRCRPAARSRSRRRPRGGSSRRVRDVFELQGGQYTCGRASPSIVGVAPGRTAGSARGASASATSRTAGSRLSGDSPTTPRSVVRARAGRLRPRHDSEPLPRAAQRKIVPDDAEEEVVADDVRARAGGSAGCDPSAARSRPRSSRNGGAPVTLQRCAGGTAAPAPR